MRRAELCQDRAWLDAFRRGERDALERVYRSYSPLVWALVRRGVGGERGVGGLLDPEAQRDLVQDIFLALFRPSTRATYDGLRPFSAFVVGVTRNLLLQHRRGSGRRDRHILPAEEVESLERWEPGAPLADELLQTQQDRALVQDFIASLDDADQQLLQLRFVEGRSQRDSAETLGLGRQQLRTREGKLRTLFKRFWAASQKPQSDQSSGA